MPLNPECLQLSPEEMARYSRHITLPHIGKEGQRRLKMARVVIIGLGGLGSPAALYLAAAGVGKLGLAEWDTVEATNLQRQILYDNGQLGLPKLDAAAARLRALNPHCVVQRHPEGFNVENAHELCDLYDLIVDGSDNFPTRYLVNDAAWLSRKPLVYGSLSQFEGQIAFFDFTTRRAGNSRALNTPCLRCLFPKIPAPGTVPNCAEAGVFGALCGTIGSLQAMEVIKYVTGAGEVLRSRLLAVEALEPRFRILNVKQDPQCSLCGANPRIQEITAVNYAWKGCRQVSSRPNDVSNEEGTQESALNDASTLPIETSVEKAKAWLESEQPPLLLDVREPFETEICRLTDSVSIPLTHLAERLDGLPKERPILVYCHHGMRSMRAVGLLHSKGYAQAVNLAGGIDAWAVTLDPSMQRY